MTEKISSPPSRRLLLAGAGTISALGAAAALLPRALETQAVALSDAAADSVAAAAQATPGYRLTEHVSHYYRTARI